MYRLKIKELRDKKKLTQQEVSQLTGVSRNYISELEHSEHSATVEVLMMLSNGLKVSPGDLIELGVDDLKLFTLKERRELKSEIMNLIKKENPKASIIFIKTLFDEILRDLEVEEQK